MNFVVCPYDGSNLKAAQRPNPPLPLLMRCPACGKQFRLAGGKVIEVTQDGDGSQT
jgi:hypothetical protein